MQANDVKHSEPQESLDKSGNSNNNSCCTINITKRNINVCIKDSKVLFCINSCISIYSIFRRNSIVSYLFSFIYLVIKKLDLLIIRIDKTLTPKIVSIISVICFLFVLSVVAYSFHSNFDNSDEGYNLYLNINGPDEAVSFTGSHTIGHYVGKLFDHKVIGYRIAELTIIVILAAYLLSSIKLFIFNNMPWKWYVSIYCYSLTCIFSCAFFIWMPSFDYNFLAIALSVIWMASFIYYLYYQQQGYARRLIFYTFMSLSVFYSVVNKLSFGIPLAILTMLIIWTLPKLYKAHKIKLSLFFMATICSMTILFLQMYPKFCSSFLIIAKFMGNNSPDNSHAIGQLITNYQKQIILFINKEVMICFIVISIVYITLGYTLKRSHKATGDLCKCLSIFILFFIAANHIPFFNYFTTRRLNAEITIRLIFAATIISILFYSLYYVNRDNVYKILYIIGLGAITSLHPAGTNTDFVKTSSLNLLVSGAILSIFLIFMSKKLTKHKLYLLTIIIALTILISASVTDKVILNYRRNAEFKMQNSYSKYSKSLKGIKIEENLAKTIDSLAVTLNNINFDRKQDKIMAYCNMPGLLTAVGARAFAESWMITGYRNSIPRMLLHINNEPIGECRNIYILKDKDEALNKFVKSVLFNKITPNGIIINYEIGKFYNYRNEKRWMNLELIGPYCLIP